MCFKKIVTEHTLDITLIVSHNWAHAVSGILTFTCACSACKQVLAVGKKKSTNVYVNTQCGTTESASRPANLHNDIIS